MHEKVKEYIEHYINLIESDEFHALYRGLAGYLRGDLTEVLHSAGIHPEKVLDHIPSEFAKDTNNIKHIDLSDNCTVISTAAFRGSCLESIKLSEHLHTIEYEAFAFCRDLTSIVIPDSVMAMHDGVFLGCSKLQDVKLSNNMQYIDKFLFCQCESLEHLSIPVSVKDIRQAAFTRCYSLSRLNYEGTIRQWNHIHKDPNWNQGKDIVEVVCIDGTISVL